MLKVDLPPEELSTPNNSLKCSSRLPHVLK